MAWTVGPYQKKKKFSQLKMKKLAEDSVCLNDVNPLEFLCESCIQGK